MLKFIQPFIPALKSFGRYLGLNTEVATKNWPSRGTYRVAPASAPAPSFTSNFPLKQDSISDLHWIDKEVRLSKEAFNFPPKLVSADPRKDIRNIWNHGRVDGLNTARYSAAHDIPRMKQVSEQQEIHL